MTKEELIKLQQKIEELTLLINEMQTIYARDLDIHTVTRQLGAYALKFIDADREFKAYIEVVLPPPGLSIEKISDNLRQSCNAADLPQVNLVLATIAAANGNEAETGVSIQYLFGRIGDLMAAYSNSVGLILDNLRHNINTGGGCAAGVAARLIQPYTAFLLEVLRRVHYRFSQELLRNPAPMIFSPTLEQQQLDLAISASLADSQQSDEDEALQLALALSRLSY